MRACMRKLAKWLDFVNGAAKAFRIGYTFRGRHCALEPEGKAPVNTEEQELTQMELLDRADKLAQRAHVGTREQAFARLDAGEFQGTIFASKMNAIRFLLEAFDTTPLAAE
jgi:hypothetical protein